MKSTRQENPLKVKTVNLRIVEEVEVKPPDAVTSLLAELKEQGITVRRADDGRIGIGVPESWTDEQYVRVQDRVLSLDISWEEITD